MENYRIEKDRGVATLTLCRGKVNALDEELVSRLGAAFRELNQDPDVRAVILTGQGAFFSFGFDVPGFLDYPPQDFIRFLTRFTGLYRQMFTLSKPLIAAINGHAIAGGCMLATACDERLMVPGKARISLNELTFGASLLAGSMEMLKYWVGPRAAQRIAYDGAMYSAEEAAAMGLADELVDADALTDRAQARARELAGKDPAAFAGIKALLREPMAMEMARLEPASNQAFTDIWYSEATREQLRGIVIR